MKKTLLSLIIILFCFLSYSQTILVSGDTLIPNIDPCNETSTSLRVKNNSSGVIDILCEKVIIDTTAGTENFFCWGGECYGSTQYLSSEFNTLNPGESDNIDFGGYYRAFCSSAHAKVRYCFFPVSNQNDKSCIDITYNGNTTMVESVKSNLFSIFPNPSSNELNINISNQKINLIEIYNVFGEIVAKNKISSDYNLKFDFSLQPKGFYYVVATEKSSIKTKKIFVLQ